MLKGIKEGRLGRPEKHEGEKRKKERPPASILEQKHREHVQAVTKAMYAIRKREGDVLRTKHGDSFSEKMEKFKPDMMKVVEVGGKVIGGTALALSSALLAGKMGPYAIPLAYTIGVKSGVNGLLSAVDYWGGERTLRLDLEKKKQESWQEARNTFLMLGKLINIRDGVITDPEKIEKILSAIRIPKGSLKRAKYDVLAGFVKDEKIEIPEDAHRKAIISIVERLRRRETEILARNASFRGLKNKRGLERGLQENVTALMAGALVLKEPEVIQDVINAVKLISEKVAAVGAREAASGMGAAVISLGVAAHIQMKGLLKKERITRNDFRRLDAFVSTMEKEQRRMAAQKRLEQLEDKKRTAEKIKGPRIVEKKEFFIAVSPKEYIPTPALVMPTKEEREQKSFLIPAHAPALRMEPKRESALYDVIRHEQELTSFIGVDAEMADETRALEDALTEWVKTAEAATLHDLKDRIHEIQEILEKVMAQLVWSKNFLFVAKKASYARVQARIDLRLQEV
ncbi:MAG: hypothetical protein Q7R79_01440 [bacterium]|nr:hypothetical protein [bacterium]